MKKPTTSKILADGLAEIQRRTDQRLDEFSARLESNRRNTLECILGQQRTEEEIRALRMLVDAEKIIATVKGFPERKVATKRRIK